MQQTESLPKDQQTGYDSTAIFIAYQAEKEKQLSKRAEEWSTVLNLVGQDKFGEAFVLAHTPEDSVISPHEFFFMGEGGNRTPETLKLVEEFRLAENHFLLEFYKNNFHRINPKSVARSLAFHEGRDISRPILERTLQTVGVTKK